MAENYTEVIDSKIFKEVTEEVKKLGDNNKKLFDDINKNYFDLKKIVDSKLDQDPVVRERMDKLATDVSTRQEILDKKNADVEKKINDRMDLIEVAMKRPGGIAGAQSSDAEQKDARDFLVSCMALNDRASWERVNKAEGNIQSYKDYVKAFQGFLRRNGDQRNMPLEDSKAMSEGIDPDGGYTVTPYMSNRILTRMWEMDPVRELASVETITTNAIEFMVDRDQSANGGWETETVLNGETDTPHFGLKRIPVNTLVARPRATQQLLEDSGINVETWLANKIADRMARVEGAAFLTGDGIGKPRGILTYADGTAWGTIEQVHMGNAALLTADGFIDVKYHMLEYFLNRGTWLMARGTVAAAMKLKDGAGEYIWKPGILAADPSSAILGLPVRMSPNVPAVAANALSVILADWKEAYMVVDRLGVTIQRDPFTAKPFVEFYTRKRVGGDVVNYDAVKIGTIEA